MKTHPGIFLRETLFKDHTVADVAREMGFSYKCVFNLLTGMRNINLRIASRLAEMTDTTITKWMLLQLEYDIYVFKKSQETA